MSELTVSRSNLRSLSFGSFQQVSAPLLSSSDLAFIIAKNECYLPIAKKSSSYSLLNTPSGEASNALLASAQYAHGFDQFDRVLTPTEDSVMRRAAMKSGRLISKGFLKAP